MDFRICVIGCGGISENVHGPSYVRYRDENPGFELTACCDLDAAKVAAHIKRFGFKRGYTDFTEMLGKEKPDAVCVTVHEDHTAEVAECVMNMGFPALIEKPPGKDSAQNRRLIEVARRNGVINQVAYNRRHMPILQKLRGMLSRETSGSAVDGGGIQLIRYDIFRVDRYEKDFSDTAVHGIDAVRYIADADYKEVNFTYQHFPQYGEGVKNIYMDCLMTSGARAQLSFCPFSGVVLERALVLAKDDAWMANTPIWAYGYDIPGEIIHIRKGKTVETISGDELCDSEETYMTNGFYNENKYFFEHVMAGRACECNLESSLNTSLIKDCVQKNLARFG